MQVAILAHPGSVYRTDEIVECGKGIRVQSQGALPDNCWLNREVARKGVRDCSPVI